MLIVYGLLAVLIPYVVLRNTRSVFLHVVTIISVAVVIAVAVTFTFHLLYPSTGIGRVNANTRNSMIPVYFLVGAVASVICPLVGAALASLGRGARIAARVLLLVAVGAALASTPGMSHAATIHRSEPRHACELKYGVKNHVDDLDYWKYENDDARNKGLACISEAIKKNADPSILADLYAGRAEIYASFNDCSIFPETNLKKTGCRVDEAIVEMEKARQTLPANARHTEDSEYFFYNWFLASTYMSVGEYDKAIAAHKELLRIEPKLTYPDIYTAIAYYRKGDLTKAREYLEKAKTAGARDSSITDMEKRLAGKPIELWGAVAVRMGKDNSNGLKTISGIVSQNSDSEADARSFVEKQCNKNQRKGYTYEPCRVVATFKGCGWLSTGWANQTPLWGTGPTPEAAQKACIGGHGKTTCDKPSPSDKWSSGGCNFDWIAHLPAPRTTAHTDAPRQDPIVEAKKPAPPAPVQQGAKNEDAMAFASILDWEKKSRSAVPSTRKKVPEAVALVRQANSLLVGEPTCSHMRQASKLLDRASDLYAGVNEIGGDVRTLNRRVSWLEDIANAGPPWCR